jgi:hypothetical protein
MLKVRKVKFIPDRTRLLISSFYVPGFESVFIVRKNIFEVN